MKSRIIRSSTSPVETLMALERKDKVQYNKSLIFHFKGYNNINHSCFINAWLQAIFVVNGFIDEIKKNPEEESNPLMMKIIVQLESHKQCYQSIRLEDFVKKWKGWMGHLPLPNDKAGFLEQQNVCDFHFSIVNSLGDSIKQMCNVEIEKIITKDIVERNKYSEKLPILMLNIDEGNIVKSIDQYFEFEIIEETTDSIEKQISFLPYILCLGIHRIKNGIKNTISVNIPIFIDL